MISNAPYGVRVGSDAEGARLFRDLGTLAQSKLQGWRMAVLVGDRNITRGSGLSFESRLAFKNGGIAVELLVARA